MRDGASAPVLRVLTNLSRPPHEPEKDIGGIDIALSTQTCMFVEHEQIAVLRKFVDQWPFPVSRDERLLELGREVRAGSSAR